jgi:hypothetical protein
MRLILATLTLAVAFTGTAIAQAVDLRAPDQVAPAPAVSTDLRAPDQVAPGRATPAVPAPALDDGPTAIFFVLIGLGAALVLLVGGYLGVRIRHRVAVADDLVTH